MFATAASGLMAFFLCLIITPVIRDIFSRAKLLDHPDEERKLHLFATPRVGGIAIVLSLTGALALAWLVAPQGVASSRDGVLLLSLLPASGIIFLTGLLDDLRTLKPWQKLIGQSLAAGVAVSLGARIDMPHAPVWLSLVISFIWLLTCANAFNLIDGLDGLAAGSALLAATAMLLSAMLNAQLALVLVAASLAGCLLAFLRYNFHPASIFLGDCGSLTIGFVLGCLAIGWGHHPGSLPGMVAPLIVLSLPLLDVFLAVVRRFLRNAPLFQGDRNHIHHKVLARALSTRRAVLILYVVSGVASTLALLFSFSQHRFKAAILIVFVTLAVAGIGSLRYVEFSAAIRSVSRRSMLRHIKEQIYLDELQLALSRAVTVEAIWDVACIACEDLHCASLKMELNDRVFYLAIGLDEADLAWSINVPLGLHGKLSVTRSSKPGKTGLMMDVLDRLQTSILQRIFDLEADRGESSVFSYRGAA